MQTKKSGEEKPKLDPPPANNSLIVSENATPPRR